MAANLAGTGKPQRQTGNALPPGLPLSGNLLRSPRNPYVFRLLPSVDAKLARPLLSEGRRMEREE